MVACRQLGYQAAKNFSGGIFAKDKFFWLDSVDCSGRENNLFDCPTNDLNYWEECTMWDHVSLECTHPMDIR